MSFSIYWKRKDVWSDRLFTLPHLPPGIWNYSSVNTIRSYSSNQSIWRNLNVMSRYAQWYTARISLNPYYCSLLPILLFNLSASSLDFAVPSVTVTPTVFQITPSSTFPTFWDSTKGRILRSLAVWSLITGLLSRVCHPTPSDDWPLVLLIGLILLLVKARRTRERFCSILLWPGPSFLNSHQWALPRFNTSIS